MKQQTVFQTTLKHDLCIGCGICKVVCPNSAIRIELNKFKEFVPILDKKQCINCGICVNFCPHTKETMQSEAKKIGLSHPAITFGIRDSYHYISWNNNNEERIKSASGGVVTKFAKYLLKNGYINGVIHAQKLLAKYGENHYEACISRTEEEIEDRASSFYAPICFEDVLKQLEENKTYLFVSTPCIIRAVKKLFKENKKYQNIKLITLALICSHNVNGQYTDYLADLNGLPTNKPYYTNLRNKDNIADANNFNTHYYDTEKDFLKLNRHQSGFTKTWRGYYFAMNCCNYCSDFWGYEADISVKDAWGRWSVEDPLGKSIVIIRSKSLDEIYKKSGVAIEDLSYEELKFHQEISSIYKQKEAFAKNIKSLFSYENRKNGLLKNVFVSRITKYLYKYFGFIITKYIMRD